MGIKGFTKTFQPQKTVSLKDLKGSRLAVDTFIEIFRSASMGHVTGLTNPKGESTQHIKTTLSNVLKMLLFGINTIWCFDGREPSHMKAPAIEERKEARAKLQEDIKTMEREIEKLEKIRTDMSSEELKEIDPTFDITLTAKMEKLHILKSRNINGREFGKYITDVKFILDCLGVARIEAPPKTDSEQLGEWLYSKGLVDGMITTDADALLYGSPMIIKKIPKKTGKYYLYSLSELLKTNVITHDELVKIGVALGCDFASEKAKGIGPKTVIQKIRTNKVQWTDEQKAAIAHFHQRIPKNTDIKITQSKMTTESLDTLKKWLVDVQGFGKTSLDKSMEFLYKLKIEKNII